MSSMNRVILIGNVGADPEIKSFQNGGKIANLRLATSETWKDKTTGEKKEKTEWHSIAVKNEGIVGVVERFVKKGSKIAVEGKLRTRKWQDQSGNDRYSTEVCVENFDGAITLLSTPQGGSSGNDRGSSGGQRGWDGPKGGSAKEDLDDDIPF